MIVKCVSYSVLKKEYKMKKLFFTAMAVLAFGFANAQSQISKGSWLIEANTGFGEKVGNTSIGLWSEDGRTDYNIGAEAGYFVDDKLALKFGLGFGETSFYDDAFGEYYSASNFAYKLGLKYYAAGKFPLEISYNGVNYEDFDENPSYLGLQAGYAIFLNKNVSIEPGIRYNVSLNDDYYDDVFQLNIGFALHF